MWIDRNLENLAFLVVLSTCKSCFGKLQNSEDVLEFVAMLLRGYTQFQDGGPMYRRNIDYVCDSHLAAWTRK
jgi:hypothetical protein